MIQSPAAALPMTLSLVAAPRMEIHQGHRLHHKVNLKWMLRVDNQFPDMTEMCTQVASIWCNLHMTQWSCPWDSRLVQNYTCLTSKTVTLAQDQYRMPDRGLWTKESYSPAEKEHQVCLFGLVKAHGTLLADHANLQIIRSVECYDCPRTKHSIHQ